MCDRAEAVALADDVESHVVVRSVRAELDLLSRSCDPEAGWRREQTAAASESLRGLDAPNIQADVAVVGAGRGSSR